MRARLRYLRLLAMRTRAPLLGLAALLFAVVGSYTTDNNEAGATFALTSLEGGLLCAWLASAVLMAEPPAQGEMVTTALGGRRSLDTLLVGILALGESVLFVAYPLILRATARPDLFIRAPQAGDVLGAVIAHLALGLLGGAVGVLFAPPRVERRANTLAAVLAAAIVLVAIAGPLGAFGGPVAVADRLTHAHAGRLAGGELLAAGVCLALAAAALCLAPVWARGRG